MKNLINNEHGQSVIENILAMALLVLVFYMIVAGSIQLFKTDSKTTRSATEYQVVSQVIETIKGEPAVYQKNFNIDASTGPNFLSNYSYGYSGSILYTGSGGNPPKCDVNNPTATATSNGSEVPTDTYCDGLMAYTILPVQTLSGLFRGIVKVRRIKKDPRDNDPLEAEYYFLINTN